MSEKSEELSELSEFSKYIQSAHKILDGKKSKMDMFTKDLLKMGLLNEDKYTINNEFPSYTGKDGEFHIADGKDDNLRKYYNGKRGLSKLLPKLVTEFDEEFIERYSAELQDYDESKVVEFAHRLHLAEGTDDIDKVSKAIAEHYSAIMKEEASPKRSKSKESKDKPMTDVNSIIDFYELTDSMNKTLRNMLDEITTMRESKDKLMTDENSLERTYSFTGTEKEALKNILGEITEKLCKLESVTKTICDKHNEINKPNDSEADKHSKEIAEYMRTYYESELSSLVNRFNESYIRIEKLCADMIEMLEPKKNMNEAFSTLILIASNISKYKCMNPDKYNYIAFWQMISQFKDRIDKALRVVDKL